MGQLQDRMEEDLRLGGYSPATRKIYLLYAKLFAKYDMRSPAEMGEEEIRQYLLHMVEKKISRETDRQIRAALIFLYSVTLKRETGFTMVLRTWGQNLLFHPHVHCVVTGGGLSSGANRWIAARERYLLPVKVLGKLFRGKFLAALDQAYRDGKLDLAGSTAELADPEAWRRFKDGLCQKDWAVYAKSPFGGAEQIFNYLGRYTHRIAISTTAS